MKHPTLYAVYFKVQWEQDDVASLWTTEAAAREELRKVKRTQAAKYGEYYLREVQINTREMIAE
jgi:hypothetical protein